MNVPTPITVMRLNILQVAAQMTGGKANTSENITVAEKLLAWVMKEGANVQNDDAPALLNTGVATGTAEGTPMGGSPESRKRKPKVDATAAQMTVATAIGPSLEQASLWEQVREATLNVRDNVSPEKLREILTGFKVEKITELVGKQYQPFIDKCKDAAAATVKPAPADDDFGV